MSNRLTHEQIDSIKAKHEGIPLVLVDTSLGDAVFRCPTSGEYRRCLDQVGEKKVALAFEALCKATVVHPDPATFTSWLDRQPGIASDCASHITELAGATGASTGKKL